MSPEVKDQSAAGEYADLRQQVFIALAEATDYEDGYKRVAEVFGITMDGIMAHATRREQGGA